MSASTQSETESSSTDTDNYDYPIARNNAKFVLARLLNESRYSFKLEDEVAQVADREDFDAPDYNVSPTGALLNRVAIAGVITDVEDVSSEGKPYYKAKMWCETGTVYVYAGEFAPDEAEAFLADLDGDVPMPVMVTGKPDGYFVSDDDEENRLEDKHMKLNAESIAEIDIEMRDRLQLKAALETHDRLEDESDQAAKLRDVAENQYEGIESYARLDIEDEIISVLEGIQSSLADS